MPIGGEYDGSIVAILDQLRLTTDLEGIAVVDLSEDAAAAPVSYCLGAAGPKTIGLGQSLLNTFPGRPSHTIDSERRPLLACPWVLPPARPGGLLMWRHGKSRPWTEEEHPMAAAVAMLLRSAIGAGGQIGIDRLTSLPNRLWFLDEAERHIDRLDLDGVVGTLVLLDVDDLRGINAALGRPQGDRVLVRIASHLRTMVRPSDVVARVGADEIAIWQDGVDHLTAAERAEILCSTRMFQDMPNGFPVSFSIGIASRPPGTAEDVRTLLRRAHMAAREVKTIGGGGWRVSHPQPISGSFDLGA